MSFLSKYYNRELDKCSPIQKSYDLVSDFSDGREVKSFVETDYPKIVESHGTVEDWSLESLMKAGVNPSFSIHTSSGSRLDEATVGAESLTAVVDNILNSNSKTE